MPDAVVGLPYDIQIAPRSLSESGIVPRGSDAVSEAVSYKYEIISGLLPEGLELDTSGLLVGRAFKRETVTFSVRIERPDDDTRIQVYSLSVAPLSEAPPSVRAFGGAVGAFGSLPFLLDSGGSKFFGSNTAGIDENRTITTQSFSILAADGGIEVDTTLPDAEEGQYYVYRIVPIAPDQGPFIFELTNRGNLPPEYNLNSDGILNGATCDNRQNAKFDVRITRPGFEGNETLVGNFEFSLQTKGQGNQCTIDVPFISPDTLTNSIFGATYNATLIVQNSTATFDFGIVDGRLPDGVTLNANGVISGSVRETGEFPLTVKAESEDGFELFQEYRILVLPTVSFLNISPDNLPEGSINEPYSQQLSTSGGVGPYNYSLVSAPSGLPAGTSFSPTGLFSGTPTEAGDFNVVVEVVDSQANRARASYTLRIVADPVVLDILPATLSDAEFEVAYSQQLQGVGGDGDYSYGVISGSLPSGLALDTEGLLSGNATQTGTFNFTVEVIDGLGNRGQRDYALLVDPVDGLLTVLPEVLPIGTFGEAYNVTLGVQGGVSPYTGMIIAGALPQGLSFAPENGQITGVPEVTGDFPLTIEITDAEGNTGQRAYTLVVLPITTLQINPPTLPKATFNAPYSEQLTGFGGDGNYTFAQISGTLPAGVTVDNAGVISGTPTQAGDFTFGVRVDDTSLNTGERSYTLSVSRLTNLDIQPTTLPDGDYGTPYSEQLTASGGVSGTYTFEILTGTLPSGLNLRPDGLFDGTPLEQGTYPLVVAVTDAQQNSGSRGYDLTINSVDGLISITPTNLPNAKFGTVYSIDLAAAGGDGSYTFSLNTGVGPLPAGLSLDAATGLIAGTPTEVGSFPVEVDVVDGQGNTGTQPYTLVVAPSTSLDIQPTAISKGLFGVPYNAVLTTVGGSGSYTYSLLTGALPVGVTLGADGVISGTPTVTGDFTFEVGVTDSETNTGRRAYTLTIQPDLNLLTITPTTLPNASYRAFYLETLTASGGDGSYTFTIEGGALPQGLTLTADGDIGGVPLELGSFNFDVLATDGQRNEGRQNYILVVDPITTITIIPSTLDDGTVGVAYSRQLTASGGDGNYSFAQTGGTLPPGLGLSVDGQISGTPSTGGIYPGIEITVTDGQGNTGVAIYSITIAANDTLLVIAPPSLPNAAFGTAYGETLGASGGTAPYTYARISGTLPQGLSLNGDTIEGTPLETGLFNLRIEAQDNQTDPNSGQRDYTLIVLPQNIITLTPADIPAGTFGVGYSEQLTASGGIGPYTFSPTGALPSGISVSSTGEISGTPTTVGTFNFAVDVIDAQSNTGSEDYTLVIGNARLDITPTQLAAATFGTAYSVDLTATGGNGNYTFSLDASVGPLPDGLGLNPTTGEISGTPNDTGSFPIKVDVLDTLGNSGTRSYTIAVNTISSLSIQPPTLTGGTYGAVYSETLSTTGGVAPYAFAVQTGALPPNLILAADGSISGTPLETGDFSFVAEVTDAVGNTGARPYTLTVLPDPNLITIAPASLPDGSFDALYTQLLTAAGGDRDYTFSVSSGALPAGISLTSDGVIIGQPQEVIVAGFDVTVTDGQNNQGMQSYTLAINPITTLEVTPPSLPGGVNGFFYSEQLGASGGDGTYSFAQTGGVLPPGLGSNTAGLISGTPTTSGTFPGIAFTVTDGQGNTGTNTYTIEIVGSADIVEISPDTLPNADFGQTYSQQLVASGGVGPYTFSRVSGTLPAGITLIGGTLSGTPTETGVFSFRITAEDSAPSPNSGSRDYTLTVNPGNVIEITPKTVPSGVFGDAYSQQLTASNGVGPYSFSATGNLPSGITLLPSGSISGTPNETGVFDFQVDVIDGEDNTGSEAYSLVIEASSTVIVITPPALPAGRFNQDYNITLGASGGVPGYDGEIISGSLPAGITFEESSGTFSGIPTETGSFPLTVEVSDSVGNSSVVNYTLVIQTIDTLGIAPASLPQADFGVAYSEQITGSGGIPAYSFSLSAGPLPNGVSLSTSGLISGTATEIGNFPITVDVTDAQNNTGQRSYTLVVNSVTTLDIQPAALPDGTFGVAYSEQLSTTGGAGGYTYSVNSGALPTGITLSSGGLVSGTSIVTGDFPLQVRVVDSVGNSGLRDYTLRIVPATNLGITPATLVDGTVGLVYSGQLSASGGVGPYSFAQTGGTIPPGLSVSNGGLVSGTPTTSGVYPGVEITVTDAQINTGVETYTITINANTNLITILPTTLPDAAFGTLYTQPLTASGGTGPYSFSVISGDPPMGITISGNALTGTPTETGTFQFRVAAQDSQMPPNAGQIDYTLVVEPQNIISITPTSLADGEFGVSYTQQLTAVNGVGSYVFSTVGPLPNGVTLSVNGLISGTPVDVGTFSFDVDVIDTEQNTGTQSYTLTVATSPTAIDITPDQLPAGQYGQTYDVTVGATGGVFPYTGAILSGTLPAGITFRTSDGNFGGIPTETGSFPLTVEVTDDVGNANQINYILVIEAIDTLDITPTILPAATFGVAYNQTLTGTGGEAPYAFTLNVGSLPAGLVLSGGGVISGTPTETGIFPITVGIEDDEGNSGQRAYTLQVATITTLDIDPDTLPAGQFGTSYSVLLNATGGTGPYTYSRNSGALPSGIVLTETGEITGSTVQTGKFNFTAEVTDSLGNTGTQPYTLTIAPIDGLLEITPEFLPTAVFGQFYEVTQGITGGVAPYVGAVTGGTLPAGISYRTSDGTFFGIPEETGTFLIDIEVTDSAGNSGQISYTLEVIPIRNVTILPGDITDGTYEQPYQQMLIAVGGDGNYTFATLPRGGSSSIGLPNGVSLSSDGMLSGTPTETGDFTFVTEVVDSSGNTGDRAYTLTVDQISTLDIQPASLPGGAFGEDYSQQFTASGGTGNYIFSLDAGLLPSGLALSVTGSLSGSPRDTGSFPITVRVTDDETNFGLREYTLVVSAQTGLIQISPDQLENGVFGGAYSQLLSATGGVGDYEFFLSGGALPAGLQLSTNGEIAGKPNETGMFTFTALALDDAMNSGSKTYAIEITQGVGVITITPSELPRGETQKAYSQQFKADGGTGGYVFSVGGGSVPEGLTLDPNSGEIAGIPVAAGSFSFSVRAVDSSGNTGAASYGLVIEEGRPDPTEDPEVPQIIDEQLSSTIELVDGQRRNILRRLSQLRTRFDCPPPGLECPEWRAWQEGRFTYSDDSAFGVYTAGIEHKLRSDLIVGAALGYGLSERDVGSFGSAVETKSTSISAYFTKRFRHGYYLDGLIGYSDFDIESQRFVTGQDFYEFGDRTGDALYMSLRVTNQIELQPGAFLSFFGRYDVQKTNLDEYSETAGTDFALTYLDTDQTVQSLSVGVGYERSWVQTWGVTKGWMEGEIGQDRLGGYSQSIFYSNTPQTIYRLNSPSDSRGSLRISGGVDVITGATTASVGLFASNAFGESSVPFGFTFNVEFAF
ncbi:MAG: putative Ig domain-containing protein [Tateyamaria sp.]|uniref:putative Ig domain-containing protein n=1 Tax=Tateyamaria sp. TaxID=1929288 RepID=UPI00329BFDB7